ncbi:oxaloacetate decarboxylase [uncultured Subdoligranulum sp.]
MNIASLATTLPMLLVGMLGIFIVIGVIILAVYLLNRVTHHSDES